MQRVDGSCGDGGFPHSNDCPTARGRPARGAAYGSQVGRIVRSNATRARSAATRTPCQSARRASSLGNGAGFEIISAHQTGP